MSNNSIPEILIKQGFNADEMKTFVNCVQKTKEQMENDIDAEKYILDEIKKLVDNNEI